MSVDLSQITFPNFVTGVKDAEGSWLKGGYDYQTQAPGWTRMHLINQWKNIKIAEHLITPEPDFIIMTEVMKVFTFPNGYYIGVQVSQGVASGSSSPVFIVSRMYTNNDVLVETSVPGANPNQSVGTSISADASILGFELNIIPNTVYYPQSNPPDGSPNLGFELSSINGWPDLGFGLVVGQNNPPYGGGWLQPEFALIKFTDLIAFEEWMKTHGNPFGGDIFTKDPISPGPAGTDDPSGPGGGGGNYDDTSDPIDFPDPPTGGALECGAVVAHRVSKQTIEAIMAKLWSYDVGSLWQKAIEEPMDAIVSLHCLPFSPDVIADSNTILVGSIDTEVTAPKVTSQYKVIDCGTLSISEYWGSALDYSPYTRAEIYLPFVGVKDLAIEDVMNNTLHIKYNVDVLTGDCIAFIKCGISVLYHFSGNCKMGVPLSSKSSNAFPNYMAGVGGIVSAAGAVATGGSSLLIAGATISAASAVAGSKVRTGRGSELTGANSLMDDFVPYIILHRPVQSLAKDYNKFKGYPSNITATLGSLNGYTEVEHVHLKNIPNATSAEMEEIESLLKGGVIL